jgi:hypothetical protein
VCQNKAYVKSIFMHFQWKSLASADGPIGHLSKAADWVPTAKYLLNNAHFHWDQVGNGSEHQINGQHQPLEVRGPSQSKICLLILSP